MTDREGLVFRKSSYSGANGGCVEFANAGDSMFAIRDSKDKTGPILQFGTQDVRSFVKAVRDDEL